MSETELPPPETVADVGAGRTGVLVVGMHRSGTSAVTRMLNLLGCALPANLLPGDAGNPMGHWESRPVVELNEAALAAFGSAWSDWSRLPADWPSGEVWQRFVPGARAVLDREFGEASPFVLKDPRLCRLLPGWMAVLRAGGTDPRVVVPVRHPTDVARSLEARDGMDRSVAYLLWLRYTLEAERASRGVPRAILRYEDLLADWRGVASRMAEALGVTWPVRLDSVAGEIDGFISPGARHHAAAAAPTAADPAAFDWIDRVHEALRPACDCPGAAPDAATLDAVQAEFDGAEDAAGQPGRTGWRAVEQASLRQKAGSLEATVAGLRADYAATEENRRLLAHQLDRIRASSSWRVTSGLRGAIRLATRLRQEARGWLGRDGGALARPWRLRVEPAGERDRIHAEVERAVLAHGHLLVCGWIWHAGAALREGRAAVTTDRGRLDAALQTGLPRDDVRTSLADRTALHSGFQAAIDLGGAVPKSVSLVFSDETSERARLDVRPRCPGKGAGAVVRAVVRLGHPATLRQGCSRIARGDGRRFFAELQRAVRPAFQVRPPATALTSALATCDPDPGDPAQRRLDRRVDVVIPVYNGREYLPALFDSLFANTAGDVRFIVVDDASPDTSVWGYLHERLGGRDDVVLLRNEENRGFAGTVNRAADAARGDFVLLNTDTEVPPGWLPRLMAPIFADASVASATPFSNAATICSFPSMAGDNPLYKDLSVAQIDRSFTRAGAKHAPIDLPTGVGFCMGVAAQAWRELGGLDAAAFERGYGEENDWCQRARRAGLRNVLVPNVFVYHKHGGSFDPAERDSFREAGMRTLLARYPDYLEQVDRFVSADPARPVRAAAALTLAGRATTPAPVLVVDHALGGGANSYRERTVKARLSAGQPVLLLLTGRSAAADLELLDGGERWQLEIADASELRAIGDAGFALDEIFYNNMVGYPRPRELLTALTALRESTGARLTLAVHDFYPVCPAYTLIAAHGSYCGVPDRNSCRQCLPFNAHATDPSHSSIDRWRAAWGDVLAQADDVLCFSQDSRAHILKAYPDAAARCRVVPHAPEMAFEPKAAAPPERPVNVGVIGGINYPKGSSVVAALPAALRRLDPNARVTVIGQLVDDADARDVTVTGRFKPAELPELVETHGVNVCLLPSICPETYSFVCDEIMALDLPLVCFDLGAPPERVAGYAKGRVVPTVDVAAAAQALVDLHARVYGGQQAAARSAAVDG
jgi:GT2 family glycosyltransferase/glycosyltransferase involved in cell wall biosynthesis